MTSDTHWPAPPSSADLCPETVPLPLPTQGGGYEFELTCSQPAGHEDPHLDPSGHVQWRATPTGIRYREEREAYFASRDSPEARERRKIAAQEWRDRRAEEEALAASKYSRGKERIRAWLEAGNGQLCWREPEQLNSVNGGGVVIPGTTAHVWFGHETACGQDRPKSSLLYSHMPEEPVRICRTCASVARRRRLPVVAR